MAEETSGRIVVGIDGSAESEDALRWALDEARRHHASLEVVHAWSFPAVAITHYGSAALPVIAPEDIQKAAEKLARETVAGVVEDDPGVPVATKVERGHPAEVLLTASKGADLSLSAPAATEAFGMLLGSVSAHVDHHATCPVAIVKPLAER